MNCSSANRSFRYKPAYVFQPHRKTPFERWQHAIGSIPKLANTIRSRAIDPWRMTMRDVRAVQQLRQKMQFGGYPFHRIQLNQIGDGLVTAAAGAILIAAASVNPILAGVFTWSIRVSELLVASVWNQRMASDRREARISACQSLIGDKVGQMSPGHSKVKACKEILSSTKYDALGAAAAVGASAILLSCGPLAGVIVLGGVIALSQTMSKFKEMAWSSLRYVVNSSEALRAQQVDLQEPMSAYEMMITVGILTASYAVGFGVLAVLFTYAAPVALPVAIGLSAAGAGLMIGSKLRFKNELSEGVEEHQRFVAGQDVKAGRNGLDG